MRMVWCNRKFVKKTDFRQKNEKEHSYNYELSSLSNESQICKKVGLFSNLQL